MCEINRLYFVPVDNKTVEPFILGSGLRQGDPLFPYLFIICAEGFSSLIRDTKDSGAISGIKVCREVPPISLILFADDCFLFFRAEDSQAHFMKNILSVYEAASGHTISLLKSEIFCICNVTNLIKHNFTNIMGVQAILSTGKYLGLPSMIGREQTTIFSYTKDRV